VFGKIAGSSAARDHGGGETSMSNDR